MFDQVDSVKNHVAQTLRVENSCCLTLMMTKKRMMVLLLLVLLLARLPVSRRRCDQSLRLSALEVTPVLNATIHFSAKKRRPRRGLCFPFLHGLRFSPRLALLPASCSIRSIFSANSKLTPQGATIQLSHKPARQYNVRIGNRASNSSCNQVDNVSRREAPAVRARSEAEARRCKAAQDHSAEQCDRARRIVLDV